MNSRRLVAGLLVAALVVAACSSDDDPTPLADIETTTTAGPGGDPSGAPTETTGTGVPPTTAGSATTQPASPDPTTTTEPIPGPGPVGSYGHLYLSPTQSRTLLVDVFTQGGNGPGSATVGHLTDVLARLSDKSVQTTAASIGGGARQWTADDIRALADQHGASQSRDTAALHLFYLRGGFAESDSALGVAVRSDVAAIFTDKLAEAAGVLGDPGPIEDAVTMHEVGHILGLVDLVLDTGREDPDHPGHSTSRDSVMYYAVESTLIGSILGEQPPDEFDAADIQDLARIREGA